MREENWSTYRFLMVNFSICYLIDREWLDLLNMQFPTVNELADYRLDIKPSIAIMSIRSVTNFERCRWLPIRSLRTRIFQFCSEVIAYPYSHIFSYHLMMLKIFVGDHFVKTIEIDTDRNSIVQSIGSSIVEVDGYVESKMLYRQRIKKNARRYGWWLNFNRWITYIIQTDTRHLSWWNKNIQF